VILIYKFLLEIVRKDRSFNRPGKTVVNKPLGLIM